MKTVVMGLALLSIILIAGGCSTPEKSPGPRAVPAAYQPPKWKAAQRGDAVFDGKVVIEEVRRTVAGDKTVFEVTLRNASSSKLEFEVRGVFLDEGGTAHQKGPIRWENVSIGARGDTAVVRFASQRTSADLALILRIK